jgi:hypothetical protein
MNLANSLASGGSALSFWGAFGIERERREVALCLRFWPSKFVILVSGL